MSVGMSAPWVRRSTLLSSGCAQRVQYVVEHRPAPVAEAVAPRLLNLDPGCPDGCVECLAPLRQSDDASAAVSGIWMALDIAQAFEFSQQVVCCLLGQPRCRSDLARPTPIHAREPEERDHR